MNSEVIFCYLHVLLDMVDPCGTAVDLPSTLDQALDVLIASPFASCARPYCGSITGSGNVSKCKSEVKCVLLRSRGVAQRHMYYDLIIDFKTEEPQNVTVLHGQAATHSSGRWVTGYHAQGFATGLLLQSEQVLTQPSRYLCDLLKQHTAF